MKKNLLVLLTIIGLVSCGGGNTGDSTQTSEGGSEVSQETSSVEESVGNSEISEESVENSETSVETSVDANSVTYTLNCSIWEVDGAWMAAYLFVGENFTWVKLEGSEGVYTVELSNEQLTTYTNIIFCRMAYGTVETIWENRWNQTEDLLLSGGTTYTITAWGENNSNVCKGQWS